jgi:hypothetical protein
VRALDEQGLWLATKSSDPSEADLFNGACKEYIPEAMPPAENVMFGNNSVETELEALLTQVTKAAGVYVDPLRQKGFEKTVVVTGCNYGFLNHLHNFKCFADRLGIKFLVVSMDQQTHSYLTNHTTMISYYTGAGKVGEVGTGSVEFRSKEFNILTAKKKEAVHDILRLGYNVLFSDTDVVWVQDPFPYVLWTNVDYVHSVNAICTKLVFLLVS